MKRFVLSAALASACVSGIFIGCSKDDKKESNTGKGSFPNFYEKTRLAVPAMTSTSKLTIVGSENKALSLAGQLGTFLANSFPTSSGASTQADEFTTAFDTKQNFIGQVLNDAGITGPVKSMFVLLTHVQSTLDNINTTYSDADGNPANCTEIDATKTITIPFFKSASKTVLNNWTDTGKYKCHAAMGSNGIVLFGRHAITDADSTCTDKYEYYVAQGSSQDDATNTELPAERGDKIDLAAINRFYYHGCTGELKMAFAHSSKYSAGVEFSSRTELTGNVKDHSFSIRVQFIDAASTYATHFSAAGTGKSHVASGSTTPVNFMMGYRSDNCGTGATSATCTEGTPKTFCAKNADSGNNYALDTTVSNCASLDTAYSAIEPFSRSDLPNGYFEVSASAFGL